MSDAPVEDAFSLAWRLHGRSWRGRLAIRLVAWAVELHSGAVTAITIDIARKAGWQPSLKDQPRPSAHDTSDR